MQPQRVFGGNSARPDITTGLAAATSGSAGGFTAGQVRWVLGASFAATALLLLRAELTIDLLSPSNLLYCALAAAIAAVRASWIGRDWRHARAIRDCAGYYGVFIAMALVGAVASYPVAALTHGYADALLARSDAALGLDWTAWYAAVANHRILQLLGIAAYQSIYLTPAVLLARFALTGQRIEAHRFLASFWLAAVLTLALFSLMPAVGPFSYLWHGPIRYMPVSELWQPDLIPALRAHTVHTIDLGKLVGLVSAPSFHAAAGALYLRTAWRAGAAGRPLLWVIGAMLLATPVEGTHYFTDMLIGAGVAVLAMALADALLARQASAPRPALFRAGA